MEQLVFKTQKGTPATDTVKIAEAFGKTHRNVLQSLDNLEISEEFNRVNFHFTSYTDRSNRQSRMVMMTRAGFVRLVMSFTGKRASAFKEQYIEQFDAMEAELNHGLIIRPARNLSEYRSRKVQMQCVKEIGSALYKSNNDPGGIIKHHRAVCRLLTQLRPRDYVRSFVSKGLRVASLSARELMRRMEPAKACTAALADDACARGNTLERLNAAGVFEVLPKAFEALMQAGYSIEECDVLAGAPQHHRQAA